MGFLPHDRYYKLEIGYGYSFFTTIEDVRISLVRVRGQAATFDPWAMPQIDEIALGIDYGRAAVTVVAHEHVRLRGAMLLGASQNGFEYGAAASIIIGNPLGSNIDVGTEGLTRLGGRQSIQTPVTEYHDGSRSWHHGTAGRIGGPWCAPTVRANCP